MTLNLRRFASKSLTGTAVGCVLAGALLVIVLVCRAGRTDDETNVPIAQAPLNWALIIGVGKVEDLKPGQQPNWDLLPFTKNDVDELEKVLVERGTYRSDRVKKLFDMKKEELQKGIEEFFRNPIDAADTVLVYYTGHGWEDDNHKLYLVPVRFELANAAGTGIAVEDLRRELGKCKAKNKIVVVDSCYAGTRLQQGGPLSSSPAASKLSNALADDRHDTSGNAFEAEPAIFAIASSSEGQSSYGGKGWTKEEEDKDFSIFSYWFIQALKGHADTELNGEVDIDEAFKFVDQRVRATTGRQTPTRNYGNSGFVSGIPVLTTLREQDEKTVYDELADQIAWEVRGLGQVVVLPNFVEKHIGLAGLYPRRTVDGGLGKVARTELYRRLDVRPGAIDDSNFANVVKDPSNKVFVQGEVVEQEGHVVKLKAEAYRIAKSGTNIQVGVAVGQMSLATTNKTTSEPTFEAPLTGSSGQLTDEDLEPRLDPKTGDKLTEDESATDRLNDPQRRKNHPLNEKVSHPPCVFRIEVETGTNEWSERKPKFVGEDAYVELNPGEVYGILIDYPGTDRVLLKLLVDGISIFQKIPPDLKRLNLNQLQQRLNNAKERKRLVDSFRATSLKVSSAWPVFGNENEAYKKDQMTPSRYLGYYVGNTGAVCQFEVVEGDKSLAAQHDIAEIGVITAVFYKEEFTLGASKEPVVGTFPGKVKFQPLKTIKIGKPGHRPLHYFSIRYVPKDVYERLQDTSEDHS